MKSIRLFSLLALTIIVLTSCETSYRFTINTPKKAVLNDKITISLKEENNQSFEKALFFVNGKEVSAQNNSFTLDTKDYGVGKQMISAMVYYGEGKTKRVNNSVEVFSNIPYQAYTYKIINSYPHDGNAFTQGLEYHNGFLYESTGRKGQSTIRKVELKTGKVVQKIDIDERYFGEGMTIYDNKVYFLTWKANKGFIYDLETFKKEKEFAYGRSKEGWGLTHSENELIKSDGTNRIWFLDATTQKEKRSIQAYNHKQKIPKLNELEYINGKIYANYWQKPLIAIINPENGIVEGIANLTGLIKEMRKTQTLKEDDVLNGIAYDKENNRLFVTGKNWKKLYEIELIKQQ
ncbi:glutaminyl-peptide cyclotransferase [Pseudotenacibaculum sp. MALMAid0570]|uniref:glutaminyl-peptide cyclotransferase n=1 Tax=Pseudotenacibaculum sp. MALMAid0570 TaxID=3143938 RepID=UPI0032DF9AE1